MKKILIYGLQDRLVDCYQIMAERYGIPVFVIGDGILPKTMDEAFCIDQDMANWHQQLQGSYMLFHGFELAEVVHLLTAFQAANLRFNGTKIIHNDGNGRRLMVTVMSNARRQALHAGGVVKIKNLLSECTGRNVQSLTPKERSEFRAAMASAEMIIKSGYFSEYSLEKVIKKLSYYMEKTHKMYN